MHMTPFRGCESNCSTGGSDFMVERGTEASRGMRGYLCDALVREAYSGNVCQHGLPHHHLYGRHYVLIL